MVENMNKQSLFTSNFNRIIKLYLKAMLLCVLLIVFLNFIMPQYSDGYNAGLIDKVERLESIDGPKIVLIGNSNLAFGIQSELLEREMQMPVVNMGLHGSLGNAFHEEMARINVHEGDIYVLCHTEYNDDGTIKDPTVAWMTLENHTDLWKLLRTEDILPMLKAYPNYLRKCLDLCINEEGEVDQAYIYSRSAFNEYGDIEYERIENIYEFSNVTPPVIGEGAVQRINALNEWLQSQGAELVITLPPFGSGEYTTSEIEFETFQEELESKLECAVISRYVDYMFDYSYFYDTNWHLTSEGATLRTEQLVQDLKQHLAKNK